MANNLKLIRRYERLGVPSVAGELMRLSWTTILILAYAMIAPSTPRRMLS